MQRQDVLLQLQSIVRTELEDDSIGITETTAIQEIADWDSAAHVRILIATETRFGIVFDVEEYTAFTGLTDMIDCICGRLDQKYATGADRAVIRCG